MGAIPADAANLNPDTHGFPGVEQRPDPVVGESSEPEGNPFDALIVLGCTHSVGVSVGGCGSDSVFRWLRALQTICRPSPANGTHQSVRGRDLIGAFVLAP